MRQGRASKHVKLSTELAGDLEAAALLGCTGSVRLATAGSTRTSKHGTARIMRHPPLPVIAGLWTGSWSNANHLSKTKKSKPTPTLQTTGAGQGWLGEQGPSSSSHAYPDSPIDTGPPQAGVQSAFDVLQARPALHERETERKRHRERDMPLMHARLPHVIS